MINDKKAILLTVIGVGIGAISGYIYHAKIRCLSGTCAITSKPLNSAVMGGLLFNMFVKFHKK